MKNIWLVFSIIIVAVLVVGCQPLKTGSDNRKTVVVTYSVLGSLVKELVGDKAEIIVSIPNGQDPHEWQPSARDIENINNASLVVCNGLGLENGLIKTLEAASQKRVPIFSATDYVMVRHVGSEEGIPSGDPDQAIGAADPHVWMDPISMQSMVAALASHLKSELNIEVGDDSKRLQIELADLDQEIRQILNPIPESSRKLVTGHESLGYFAERYNFKLIGAIVPSISTQAAVSAADMASLKTLVQENQVKAIFSELGTSPAAAKAISEETHVKVIELNTHRLPPDGRYDTFMKSLAFDIVEGLK